MLMTEIGNRIRGFSRSRPPESPPPCGITDLDCQNSLEKNEMVRRLWRGCLDSLPRKGLAISRAAYIDRDGSRAESSFQESTDLGAA
jgi:hypothetical protein